jgi:nucleotide-binding universal stress UspA family protein
MVSTVRPAEQPQAQHVHAARPIVVGVDARGRSASAVVWAAGEAQRTGRTLHVVTAHDRPPGADAGHHGLASLARRLTLTDVAFDDLVGSPDEVLLGRAAAEDAQLLVVGSRTMAAPERALVGSTSRAVVARARVPVVVVPEPWIQPSTSSAPIVVGVGSRGASGSEQGVQTPDGAALGFAFERARWTHVPLIVVSAHEMPALYAWSPVDVSARKGRNLAALEERLASWRRRYPDVEVLTRCPLEPAHLALLDASTVAQLTVVGRHLAARAGRLPLGSTARSVLYRAERPVAVVPVPSHDRSGDPAEARGRSDGPAWAPMF